MPHSLIRLLLMVTSLVTSASTTADSQEPVHFLDADEVTWKVNQFPVTRWKTLVGGIEGGQIDQADVQFGLWELAPHGIYHGHKHAAPEIYHILDGEAEWTVGNQTRQVRAGMTIHTPPNTVHKMVNHSERPVKAIWFWWAPNGDRQVFRAAYEFTEPAPTQSGVFSGDEIPLYSEGDTK